MLLRGGALGRRRLRRRESRLELRHLTLQVIDQALVLADVRLDRLQVLHDVRLDLLCAVGVLERVDGVRVLVPAATHVGHHRRARISGESVLQQTRQLRVSKRHVHTLTAVFLTKRVDAIGERQQRSVYVPTVSQFLTHVERL